MGSLALFDFQRVALEFLAIQADRMGRKQLEIEFRKPTACYQGCEEGAIERIRLSRLQVDTRERKAFYATDESAPLAEFSRDMLNNMAAVRLI